VLLCVAIPAAGLSPQSALRQHPLWCAPQTGRTGGKNPVTTFPRAVFALLTCL